ncbi:cold-shock protein [Desulfopila aestuarii]|uniref:cold-shock protein n=1 Tax=Desulfopila aestuarii TaxID=231440 RepID=UPI000935F1BB|nr:cold shock domain-containing protein [Desulfopila aestuarii]
MTSAGRSFPEKHILLLFFDQQLPYLYFKKDRNWLIFVEKELSQNGSMTRGGTFIAPEKGRQEIFVHSSAFDRDLPRRPRAGDTIYYSPQKDESTRQCSRPWAQPEDESIYPDVKMETISFVL